MHCTKGLGIWDWASTHRGGEPDVVLACAGDIPTPEVLGLPICSASTAPSCGCGWSTWSTC